MYLYLFVYEALGEDEEAAALICIRFLKRVDMVWSCFVFVFDKCWTSEPYPPPHYFIPEKFGSFSFNRTCGDEPERTNRIDVEKCLAFVR